MTRGSSRAAILLGTLALGACAWWAFKPLPDIASSVPALDLESATDKPADVRVASLDLEPFRAPLWVAPPPPPPPPPTPEPERPPPPPPPIKYQLLAVLGLEDRDAQPADLRAALYDPDADCILIVRVGEPIEAQASAEQHARRRSASRTSPILEEVSAEGVVIRDSAGNRRTLSLRTDEGAKR